MDFELDDWRQRRYDDLLAAVGDRLGKPDALLDPGFDHGRWQAAADLGLTGLCLPVEHGGGGLGPLDTALAMEAFGQGCPDTGLVFAVAAHLLACAVPVNDFADEPARMRLLPGLATGRIIAANAMTEDEAGSDLSRLAVTAEPDGDGYLLDGEKSFASNAPVADLIVTYATTDPRAGFLGLTAFAVPRDLPGVEIGPAFAKMGLDSCAAGRVRFHRCRVPASLRLGEEGQGRTIFQHSMSWERGCLFAAYLGLMERQLRQCVERVARRRQFGRRLADFQAVSHRIAGMKQRMEGARLLLYRAVWLLQRGRDHSAAVALAKVAVSEAAVANSLDAVQLFGGAGYLADSGVERQLRDCLPSRLFSGSNEVLRELIAKDVGL